MGGGSAMTDENAQKPRRSFRRRFFSRRFLVFSLLIAGTAFTVGTVLSQTIPKIKSWLLVSIDEFSRENLPVRILPGAVDFRIVPLGITLNDVRILPTAEFEKENGKAFFSAHHSRNPSRSFDASNHSG
jgi:hypothetical protein